MKTEVVSVVKTVVKRDGRNVAFDIEKITFAIYKALRATGTPDRAMAKTYATEVIRVLNLQDNSCPTVEYIQDTVEQVLFANHRFKAAKAYIIYRYQHQNIRNAKAIFSNIDLVDDYLTPKRLASERECQLFLLFARLKSTYFNYCKFAILAVGDLRRRYRPRPQRGPHTHSRLGIFKRILCGLGFRRVAAEWI